MKRLFVALLLASAGAQLPAQEANQIWEEYGKRLESSVKVAPLGPNLFGDQVSLSNGALSFSVTDVSIPGNNSLPVAFTRTFTVRGRKGYYLNNDFPLADWEIDLPNISGVFATDWVSGAAETPNKRCSVTTVVAARPPPVWVGSHLFYSRDYWHGHNLSLPTGGGEMLLLDAADPRPSTGGPYYWVTGDQTRVSCLPAIKNWAGGGEGFLAVAPDGTRYWFDWMAQYLEPTLESTTTTVRQGRRRNVLYATRVEDRFGNWVAYTYANARTAPVRLTRIQSSDGRRIDVGYDTQGRVDTVTAYTRTWQYRYAAVNSVDDTLTSVILPDASSWSIDLAGLLTAGVQYTRGVPGEPWRSCIYLGDLVGDSSFSGTMKHPSGATGQFTVAIEQHGRTNVPVNCDNFTSPGNDRNDDLSFWPIYHHALSLTTKTITGPGLQAMTWRYDYSSPFSYFFPSGDSSYPVCPYGKDCSLPSCTSDDCAGSITTTVTDPAGNWVRYHHGNSYRYNEGKLIKVETGTGATVLRTITNTYDLTQVDQEYPAKWGTSPRMRDEGFTSEYHRPLWHKATVQNGTGFNYRVDAFDEFARPTKVTRSSTGVDGAYIDPPASAPVLTAPATSNDGAFAVTWTAVGTATSYQLEQRKDGGSWGQIYADTALTHAVSGLGNGSYDFRIQACNLGGCGTYSAIRTTVVTLPPPHPAMVSAPSASNDGAFTVSWGSVDTATNYRLEQRKNSGSWTQIYSGAARSKAVSGLPNGSYGYRMHACNAGGCSGYSIIDTTVVTWPPATAPTLSAPQSASTTDTYPVRWTLVATATRYDLQMNRDSGSWATIYSGTGAYQSQNQRYEGSYGYRVRACNVGGCSPFSPAKSVLLYGGGGGGDCGYLCPEPVSIPPDGPSIQSLSDEGGA